MNVSHKRGIREHTWKYCLRFYIQVGTTATVPHAAHRQHSVRLRQQLPCLHSCLLHASEQRAHLVPPQLERRPFLREWQEVPCSGLSESSCSPSKRLHVLPQLFASCVWEGIQFTGPKYLWIVRYFFLKPQKKKNSSTKNTTSIHPTFCYKGYAHLSIFLLLLWFLNTLCCWLVQLHLTEIKYTLIWQSTNHCSTVQWVPRR